MITLLVGIACFKALGDGPQTEDEFFADCLAQTAAMRNDPPATESDIYIDPSITGAERTLLHDEMLGLPVSIIKDFIYVDDHGGVHANKPELLQGMTDYVQVGPNQYQSSSGEIISRPGGSTVGDPVIDPAPEIPSHGPSVGALLYPPTGVTGSGGGPFWRAYQRARTAGLWWCNTYGTTPPNANISPYNVAPADIAWVYDRRGRNRQHLGPGSITVSSSATSAGGGISS